MSPPGVVIGSVAKHRFTDGGSGPGSVRAVDGTRKAETIEAASIDRRARHP